MILPTGDPDPPSSSVAMPSFRHDRADGTWPCIKPSVAIWEMLVIFYPLEVS